MVDRLKIERAEERHQLRARIAELEAEVERLTKELAVFANDYLRKSVDAKALSRTGAVKALLDPDMPAQELRLHMGEMSAQEIRTARAAIRWANTRLSALEPAVPEGQQPVALTYGQKLIAEAIEHHFGERGENYDEYEGDTTVDDVWDAFDALTRPSEQAVTEAMVDKFIERYELGCSHRYDRNSIREALKAAMEAGR